MFILSNKNTMIIIKLSSKIKNISENKYKKIIQLLNFSELTCPGCDSKGLFVHAYYYRHIDIFKRSHKVRVLRLRKRSHKVRVLRLRCPECGSTHAVLVEDMIPYSIASFNVIIEVIADIDFLESSHVAFLKEKYLSYFFDYVFFCKLNTRNNYFNLVQLTT